MVRAIVLAAGESRRMGRPKAELEVTPGGPTFAGAVVRTLQAAGLGEVVVVAGAHPAAVRASLAGLDSVRVVDNPSWHAGQLSSLLTGLDAVDAPAVEAVLVALVDSPLVRPATVRALLARWAEARAPVVRPVIAGRHGHPVIFDRAAFGDLRAAPHEVGAKAVIARWGTRVVDLAVDDPGVLADLDTPEDVEAALGRRPPSRPS